MTEKRLKTEIEWRIAQKSCVLACVWLYMKKGMEIDSRKIYVIVVQITSFYLHFLVHNQQQQMNG